ncbi:periplasmic nitrate reductase, NapE protein [Azoarcus sp. PA01]|nr:periplasmic nitrate reductase, NapE protein [Azoarcus sp. PA01]
MPVSPGSQTPSSAPPPSTPQEELRSFLFLAVVTAPVLAVIVVGGYGFLVWMYQLLSGRLPTA